MKCECKECFYVKPSLIALEWFDQYVTTKIFFNQIRCVKNVRESL